MAILDQNHIPPKLAVLNTDTIQGQHIVPIAMNVSNGGILINEVATISFTMQPIDPHDDNWKKVWCFQGGDGLVYPAVATADGELLIDSN